MNFLSWLEETHFPFKKLFMSFTSFSFGLLVLVDFWELFTH